MGRIEGIISKMDNALRRVTPVGKTAYKRKITRTGGNAFIGRPGSVTFVDTLLDPQPIYTPLGREKVSGGHDTVETIISGTSQIVVDDMEFIISASSITEAELEDVDTVLVLKDSSGGAEVFHMMDYSSTGMEGIDALYTVLVRSVDRP